MIFVAAAAWVALSVVMFVAEGCLGAHYLASVVVPLGILSGLVTFALFGDGVPPPNGGRYVDELDPVRDLVRTRYTSVGNGAEWPAYSLAECAKQRTRAAARMRRQTKRDGESDRPAHRRR